MKRFLTIIAFLAVSATALFAQTSSYRVIEPGMKYKELKNIYDSKEYVKSVADPYNKTWIGIGSFFMPGIGQIASNETRRGFAFIGGSILVSAFGSYFADSLLDVTVKDADGNYEFTDEKAAMRYVAMLVASGAAELALAIWSSADAVKVAKVKNMYYGDLMKQRAMEVKLHPSFDVTRTSDGLKPVAGMTLAVNF